MYCFIFISNKRCGQKFDFLKIKFHKYLQSKVSSDAGPTRVTILRYESLSKFGLLT